MLGELDVIADDSAALAWAFGSAAALAWRTIAHGGASWRALRRRALYPSAGRVAPVLLGIVAALAVLASSIGLLILLMRASAYDPRHEAVAERLFVVAIPEAIYLAGAVLLWRPRRRVACGMLAAGAILFTHSIFHVMAHG
jgi:hypothetical protein